MMLIAPVDVTDFDDVNEGDGGLVVLPGSRAFSCCGPLHGQALHNPQLVQSQLVPCVCCVPGGTVE
jgi:hypothetical protein